MAVSWMLNKEGKRKLDAINMWFPHRMLRKVCLVCRALTADGLPATDLVDVAKLQSEMAAMGFLCRLRRSFSTVLYGIFTAIVG